MYTQAATLATASSWFLWRWFRQKPDRGKLISDWKFWAVFYFGAATLLCLTHLVGTMVLLAQGLFAVAFFMWQRRFRQAAAFLFIALICVAAVGCWAAFVISVKGVFFSPAHLGWIPTQTFGSGFRFLVDQFFCGFCGGMPDDIRRWVLVMAWVLVVFVLGSAVVRSVRFVGLRDGKGLADPLGIDRVFLLWLVMGPVLLALLTSYLFHPVYFPPRFSLLVLSPFLLLVALECDQLKSELLRIGTFIAFLMLMGVGSWGQASAITKTGMAEFAEFWHKEGPPDAAVFSPGHIRAVAAYYTGQKTPRVRQTSLEERLRETRSMRLWVCSEVGAFQVADEDRRLADWAMTLGSNQRLGIFDRILITEVAAEGFSKIFPPLPNNGQINFGSEEVGKYLWSGWRRVETKHRWSRGKRAEVVFALEDPQHFSRITMEMFCFLRQEITVVLNEKTIDSFVCESRTPHLREIIVPQGGFETKNALVFELPDAVAPNQVSESRDARVLALGIRWLRVDEGS